MIRAAQRCVSVGTQVLRVSKGFVSRNFSEEVADIIQSDSKTDASEAEAESIELVANHIGSASPWAVFGSGDAWGADYLQEPGAAVENSEDLLSDEAVQLPLTRQQARICLV